MKQNSGASGGASEEESCCQVASGLEEPMPARSEGGAATAVVEGGRGWRGGEEVSKQPVAPQTQGRQTSLSPSWPVPAA